MAGWCAYVGQKERIATTSLRAGLAMTGEGTSSIVPRKPPSLVQKWGIQWGRSPLGREEGYRGTFMEWFPGRVFAFFRRAAKEGRSRRSERTFVLSPSPPQRAILRASADSPLVSTLRFPVPSPPAGFFLCSPKERSERNAPKGTYPEGGSLWNPSPSARGLRPP